MKLINKVTRIGTVVKGDQLLGSSDHAIAYKSLDVFSLSRKHKSQSLMTAKVLAKKVSSRTESMGRTHSENASQEFRK